MRQMIVNPILSPEHDINIERYLLCLVKDRGHEQKKRGLIISREFIKFWTSLKTTRIWMPGCKVTSGPVLQSLLRSERFCSERFHWNSQDLRWDYMALQLQNRLDSWSTNLLQLWRVEFCRKNTLNHTIFISKNYTTSQVRWLEVHKVWLPCLISTLALVKLSFRLERKRNRSASRQMMSETT